MVKIMIETIKKEFVNCILNKYGEVVEVINIPIDFKIEYKKLNAMCKDIVKILKDEHIHSLSLISIDDSGFMPEIERITFRLVDVKKIVFQEYYMLIDGRKFLYNAIFNFYGID